MVDNVVQLVAIHLAHQLLQLRHDQLDSQNSGLGLLHRSDLEQHLDSESAVIELEFVLSTVGVTAKVADQ